MIDDNTIWETIDKSIDVLRRENESVKSYGSGDIAIEYTRVENNKVAHAKIKLDWWAMHVMSIGTLQALMQDVFDYLRSLEAE